MLELKNITKDYAVAGGAVHALKGVNVKFRKNEFVSVLGASGCGKTTLLNIIGGLDKYTSGDLIIEGRSTKNYNDGDWDTYRNHSVGFIFQSYHLIPHQTILQNVELALTISGVSKEERRQRAEEALAKVGLSDKLNTRPNQLSGGQAQRVAIARALINDPEIVLADEPTGALDSKTSVQIMELLKEVSKDRLVIMVTHNPELAEKYSTRIIRLLDGQITDDTAPYDGADEQEESVPAAQKGKKKKASMSVGMAFSLSLKNLLSKRKRTALVSVAGSIGIIGVSMVLAISAGVKAYIASMENDMLSGYPLTVTETAIDFNALMDFANASGTKVDIERLDDKVYVDSLMQSLMGMGKSVTTNNLTKDYISYIEAMPEEYYNALQYGYNFDISNNIYTDFKIANDGIAPEVDASGNYSVTAIRQMYTSVLRRVEEYSQYASIISTASSFYEMPNNYEYILSQYDILASRGGKTRNLTEAELKDIFENKDSLVMVLNDNAATDITLGQFAYLTQEEFLDFAYKALKDNGIDDDGYYDEELIKEYFGGVGFDYFVGENAHSFTFYPNDTVYSPKEDGDKFYTVSSDLYGADISGGDISTLAKYFTDITSNVDFKYNHCSDGFDKTDAVDLKVKVILQKKKGISYGCLSSGLYYTEKLTEHMRDTAKRSAIVKHIEENGALSYLPYNYSYTYVEEKQYHRSDNLIPAIPQLGIPEIPNTGFITQGSGGMGMMGSFMMGGSADPLAAYRITADTLGGGELPSALAIYPLDFDNKQYVTEYLDKWNAACESEGGTFTYQTADGKTVTVEGLAEADKVTYTDTVGLIITMVNTMIQMITVALIAFTALSLVVSTVMVGIITYVSVVERIKEIGILRAVGARKKDIKRLFNAETFIIGLAAGIVGIAVTYLLSLILNLVLGSLFGIYTIAALPWWQALVMILISVCLTLVSGLIPAAAAAKKDPVVALRTE